MNPTRASALVALAAISVFTIPAPAAAQESDAASTAAVSGSVPDETTDRVTRSVGLVRSAGVNGSGWVAGEDTVVTNLHVARAGTGDIFIDYADGERIECYTVAADRDMDLAVLKCETGARPIVPLRTERLAPGTQIATIGYPGGVGPTVSKGELLPQRDVVRGITTVAYSASTAPGSSGSPVVDAEGRAVAVVTFSGGRGVPGAELVPVLEAADGLPVTKQGAENRLRLRRSAIAAVLVFPLSLLIRRRYGRDPLVLGAVRWTIGGIALALALTQAQFMMIGPTTLI